MAKLYLVANYVTSSGAGDFVPAWLASAGHLQIVFEDGSVFTELEVQAPIDGGIGGGDFNLCMT